MEITNNTAAGVYTNNYKNKNVPGQDYENTMKRKTSEPKSRKIRFWGWDSYIAKTTRYITGCAPCTQKIIQRRIRLFK